MESTRLLERIRAMARDPKNRKPANIESLQQSILNHLTRMLNTRQGSSIIASDYGVPDFSALCTSPNADNITRIENILLEVVQRYEPRLKNVQVRFTKDKDDPLKMSFTLSAELSSVDEQNNAVFFQTVLSPNGRINIRRHQHTEEA